MLGLFQSLELLVARVFVAAGAWFVLFGLSGKLSTLISAIPAPVIGGVFVVVCGIISVSGMKVMSDVNNS